MKKIGKRSIWISIVVASMFLTGCGNQTGSGDRATGSDAGESVPGTTEVAGETTTEAALEVVSNESKKPEAVPATTEIGGGKKKAEETTEEKKPSTTGSTKPSTNHSNNSGSASSGQSTTPKPSNSGSSSGNSGNSGSGNSGNSGSNNGGNSNSTPSPKPATPVTTEAPATTEAPKPATTEAPTTQHQHVYDQEVIDTPAKSIYHPEEGYYVDAVKCHICGQVFTSMEALDAHADHGAESYGSTTPIWVKTKDEYTEVIPAKTHRECKCGARE